jgi:hypothetical protein
VGAFSCAVSHAYLHRVICSPAAASSSITRLCSSSAATTASAAARFLHCILAHVAAQPVVTPSHAVYMFNQYQRCSHQRHSSLLSAFFKHRRTGFSCWNKRRLAA